MIISSSLFQILKATVFCISRSAQHGSDETLVKWQIYDIYYIKPFLIWHRLNVNTSCPRPAHGLTDTSVDFVPHTLTARVQTLRAQACIVSLDVCLPTNT